MSTNNYILNLLNIKNENIHIITKCNEKLIKGKNYKIIEAFLTYSPESCPCCEAINHSYNDIIKWGFRRNCIVKIPKQGNCLTRLFLHKQRFFVNIAIILSLLKLIWLIETKIFLIIQIYKLNSNL